MNPNETLPVVYVTKYALTRGILVYRNAIHCRMTSDTVISVGRGGTFLKPFWYTDLAEARAHAEKQRKAKLASIAKQTQALQTMQIPLIESEE